MPRRAFLRHVVTAAILVAPAAAGAQATYERESQYEQEYGDPIDISVTDLDQSPEAYINKAVRTRATLELDAGGGDILRDSLGAKVAIFPVEEVRDYFERQRSSMMGRRIDVTGVVKALPDAGSRPPGLAPVKLYFWSFLGSPEESDAQKKALEVSLVLEGGRQVELLLLLLLPGIVDSEGLALGPRAALGVEGFADILRYSTGP